MRQIVAYAKLQLLLCNLLMCSFLVPFFHSRDIVCNFNKQKIRLRPISSFLDVVTYVIHQSEKQNESKIVRTESSI